MNRSEDPAIRPHILSAGVPPLAAHPSENRVQDRHMTYKVVHVLAPFHMCRRPIQWPIAAFCRHQSPGSTYQQTVVSTIGSRAFPVTGPQTWNDLPEQVTLAESLTTFHRLLKTHLFRKSFRDYLLDVNWLSPVDLTAVPLLRPPKTFWLTDWSSTLYHWQVLVIICISWRILRALLSVYWKQLKSTCLKFAWRVTLVRSCRSSYQKNNLQSFNHCSPIWNGISLHSELTVLEHQSPRLKKCSWSQWLLPFSVITDVKN